MGLENYDTKLRALFLLPLLVLLLSLLLFA